MKNSKIKERINKKNSQTFYESLYKGACVKIEDSVKTFQVIGINPEKKVCWIREWPFAFDSKKTFPLEINRITIKTCCTY